MTQKEPKEINSVKASDTTVIHTNYFFYGPSYSSSTNIFESSFSDFSKIPVKPPTPSNGTAADINANGTIGKDSVKENWKTKKMTFNDYYDDKESRKLLKSDPLQWKTQDHYAILGLGRMRRLATPDDIKKAYRKKALKHHPDKKNETDVLDPDSDNYFKCVQKGNDSERRRQYDSVDDKFDNSVPTKIPSNSDFYCVFGPVNSHFSTVQPVPDLGDENSSRKDVEAFYEFWTNFQSWRSFEFMDEDPVDSVENRDERRWLEKKNKAQRQKLKKDENARILKLVDSAIGFDPRLKKFKEDDKREREAKKRNKDEEATREKERLKQAQLEEKAAEEELKVQAEKEKQEKAAKKGKLKEARRRLRQAVSSYSLDAQIDAIVSDFGDKLDLVESFGESLETNEDPVKLVLEEYSRITGEAYDEKIAAQKVATKRAETPVPTQPNANTKVEHAWSPEEIKLLIKAVNMYPGGTLARWEKIADFLKKHTGSEYERTQQELVKKSKEVQGTRFLSNNASFLQTFERTKVDIPLNDEPTINPNLSQVDENNKINDGQDETTQERPWSNEEQAQLEKALKSFPASQYKGQDRWDKVASVIKGRSKKEVIKRVKECIKMKNSKATTK